MDFDKFGQEDRGLVDFIIIGAMKGGTTHLAQILSSHPGINMSDIKEPNFFNEGRRFSGRWALGPDWYRSIFPKRDGLRGEASTSYTKNSVDRSIARRIIETCPKVKLIYLVRHPIQRAISHYLHNVIIGRETETISQALLSKNSHYIQTSSYYRQLSPYTELVPQKNLCVLQSEALWSSPHETLRIVYDFLGLPVTIWPRMRTETHTLTNRLGDLGARMRDNGSNGAQRQLSDVLASWDPGTSLNSSSVAKRLGLSEEHVSTIGSYIESDVDQLERYLDGRQFHWSWPRLN